LIGLPLLDSRIKEACGLFGVFGRPDAVELTYLGIYAQQHRGQESAGICTSDGSELQRHADLGLVTTVFDQESLAKLSGHAR